MKAVLNPAAAESFAVSPSHTAGMTTKPGSANKARRRSGAVMTFPSEQVFSPQDMRVHAARQMPGDLSLAQATMRIATSSRRAPREA